MSKTLQKFLIPVLVVGAVLISAVLLLTGEERKYVNASFPQAIAIYEGSEVRILGVTVGKVEEVTPNGTEVTVRMWYDAEYQVPANADAQIVAPSVVGDRYIQLTPVYTQGAVLEDGATLVQRAGSTPLELDEIFGSLNELNIALGPEGANKDGVLSDLLTQTAENFDGQGGAFKQTIEDFSTLAGTLDNNKEELFSASAQLEAFISTLAQNDATVRQFNQSLADVSVLLEGERVDLAEALANLGTAMREVRGFVGENREVLTRNIGKLNDVLQIVVNQREALEETLHIAPLALNDQGAAYNPQAGTLDTRSNAGDIVEVILSDPAQGLCNTLGGPDPTGGFCNLISGLLPRVAPGTEGENPVYYYKQYVDPTLGGLIEPTKSGGDS